MIKSANAAFSLFELNRFVLMNKDLKEPSISALKYSAEHKLNNVLINLFLLRNRMCARQFI